MDKKITVKSTLLFLVILFLTTYAYGFFILFPQWKEIGSIGALNLGPVMLLPALAVVVTKLITREGLWDKSLNPSFVKGRRIYYLLSWFLPFLLCLLGAVLYFIFNRSVFSYDLEYYMGVLKKQGTVTDAAIIRKSLLSSMISNIIFAPVLNVVTCFSEEWGFRGFLLSGFKKLMGLPLAVILSGFIWGLWYLPLTVMGHNYGVLYKGYPLTGVLAMCIFCIFTGICFSFVRVRTGSIWPAVIAHGSLNAFASIGIYFTRDGGNPFIGPSVTGLIGGLPIIILSLAVFVKMLKDPGEREIIANEKEKSLPTDRKVEIREAQRKMPENKEKP
ncbi:MAG: CPBP family intramembrane metalloprotease [Lachnospiraceae bacterium]|nr:CPBP family intramembrane metalloprotease [Lachnospiraceae bacterium]